MQLKGKHQIKILIFNETSFNHITRVLSRIILSSTPNNFHVVYSPPQKKLFKIDLIEETIPNGALKKERA